MSCPGCNDSGNSPRVIAGVTHHEPCKVCPVWRELVAARRQHERDLALLAIAAESKGATVVFYLDIIEQQCQTIARLQAEAAGAGAAWAYVEENACLDDMGPPEEGWQSRETAQLDEWYQRFITNWIEDGELIAIVRGKRIWDDGLKALIDAPLGADPKDTVRTLGDWMDYALYAKEKKQAEKEPDNG